jgi:hypothetical protein
MTEIIEEEYLMPLFRLEGIEDAIAKLNKKAKKLGLPEIEFSVDEEIIPKILQRNQYSKEIVINCRNIKIKGKFPCYEGWNFIATVDYGNGEKNLLRSIPSFDGKIPNKYRTANIECDHCKTKRNRKNSFLVLHEVEGWKQIGKNCIKDYLGGKSPHDIATVASDLFRILCDMEESGWDDFDPDKNEFWGGCGSTGVYLVNVIEAIAATFYLVDNFGYASAKMVQNDLAKETTKSRVWDHFHPPRRIPLADQLKYRIPFTDEDQKQTAEALKWLKQQDDENNDFIFNLKVACSLQYQEYKNLGYICALVPAYQKALNIQKEHDVFSKLPTLDEYLGKVGERLRSLSLTVIRVIPMEGYWSETSYLHICKDSEGRMIKFSHKEKHNQEIVVDGTVKDHSTYKEVKQTSLNRVKIQES